MKYLDLYKKIGRKPLRMATKKDVTVIIDGQEYYCVLEQLDNGNDWRLEAREKVVLTEEYPDVTLKDYEEEDTKVVGIYSCNTCTREGGQK